MTKPSITVAIIALDERPMLSELLPALAWADERLVIDGGSRDESPAIARALGARVVERPFDNFAAQRNAAMEAAASEWLLFVDADERPSHKLPAEIRRRVEGEAYEGYRVPVRSTIFGRRFRFSGTQDDLPLRLVRRDGGRWHGAVHEQFQARGAVGRLEAHLEHCTLPTIQSFLGKMQRYTTLAAETRVLQGRPPTLLDAWVRPGLEVFRRLVWKQGWLDGPQGWAFCALSGLSEWVSAKKHRRLWKLARNAQGEAAR